MPKRWMVLETRGGQVASWAESWEAEQERLHDDDAEPAYPTFTEQIEMGRQLELRGHRVA